MSDAVGRELPGLDTFPGLVLALTALSGELPAALVSRLPASDTYKEYAVKQLKRDNLLRTFYRNGVRGPISLAVPRPISSNRKSPAASACTGWPRCW